jgi:hypothetical protein
VSVQANTVYQNANAWQSELRIYDNISALTVRDNIFWSTSGSAAVAISSVQTGAVTIDYNLNWSSTSGGAPANDYGTLTGMSWAAWQALGFDQHGMNTNPNFTSATNRSFTLQAGSPAIGAGVYLPGVSATNPPNIGAW